MVSTGRSRLSTMAYRLWPVAYNRASHLPAKQQHRHLDRVPHAIDGGSMKDVAQEAVPVRGHRDQVDTFLVSDANQLGGRIPHGQPRVAVESSLSQRVAALGEIYPV